MRVVIINKSDITGGAAIVSRRLMEALRKEGIDAKMLVIEKLTDSPNVVSVYDNKGFSISRNGKKSCFRLSDPYIRYKFLLERLKIFIANGFNRQTLFKIDSGEEGLPLWNHPLVKDADAILINWINQGMLSLKGIKKIQALGKPLIWTMHDMWEMTGICHHAGTCDHFIEQCGKCHLLGNKASSNDLSHKIWKQKFLMYSDNDLMKKTAFVAVSTWLKSKALQSSLLKAQRLYVIPNAFNLSALTSIDDNSERQKEGKIRILFGAARLDDPIKGLDTFKETCRILKNNYPDIASNLEVAMFGNIKNPLALEGFELPLIHLGILRGDDAVKQAYKNSHILVSSSSYETLPGTLVEAQAYGCIPVSFNQGGQKDIVNDGETGFIAQYDETFANRAENLSRAIIKAVDIIGKPDEYKDMICRMQQNVKNKFSYSQIAKRYIALIEELA